MDQASNCGCTLPAGHRGTGGWHLRPAVHPESKARNFEAYERCEAYWSKAGYTVDPTDRRRLLGTEQTKKTRRVRA